MAALAAPAYAGACVSRVPGEVLFLSGLRAEAHQVHEGGEEAVQPALVSHALLHHLLLPRVLSSLLHAVRLHSNTQEGNQSTPL